MSASSSTANATAFFFRQSTQEKLNPNAAAGELSDLIMAEIVPPRCHAQPPVAKQQLNHQQQSVEPIVEKFLWNSIVAHFPFFVGEDVDAAAQEFFALKDSVTFELFLETHFSLLRFFLPLDFPVMDHSSVTPLDFAGAVAKIARVNCVDSPIVLFRTP